MIRKALLGALMVTLQACTSAPVDNETTDAAECVGSTTLPSAWADKFVAVDDPALLASSLGQPLEGKLCQGKVYQATEGVTVYRAWNSTNPHSQFGHWWALSQPSGLVADYRQDYDICYQWSPLDKLVQCTLQPGTKIVVGNGQSAKCSEYLTYPTSSAQQVYLQEAEQAVQHCQTFDAVMRWQ
nr:hypothetical protein [Salinivibrio sp. IB872]